jgi:hypothetical protein
MSCTKVHQSAKQDAQRTNIETRITRVSYLSKSTRCTNLFLLFGLLCGGQTGKAFFQCDAKWYQWIAGVVCIDPGFDFWEPG